jgi:hypothetical protein
MPRYAFEIPDSPVRERLAQILDAGNIYYKKGATPDQINQVVAHGIGSITGITIIAPGEYTPRHTDCSIYTFRVRERQPWARPWLREGAPGELWDDGITFLGGRGYAPTLDPQPQDVIAYGEDAVRGRFIHFGIYEGDGYVTSKFDMGPILHHPIDAVDTLYGSEAIIFTRLSGR